MSFRLCLHLRMFILLPDVHSIFASIIASFPIVYMFRMLSSSPGHVWIVWRKVLHVAPFCRQRAFRLAYIEHEVEGEDRRRSRTRQTAEEPPVEIAMSSLRFGQATSQILRVITSFQIFQPAVLLRLL
jgi:hypothetical protein